MQRLAWIREGLSELVSRIISASKSTTPIIIYLDSISVRPQGLFDSIGNGASSKVMDIGTISLWVGITAFVLAVPLAILANLLLSSSQFSDYAAAA